MKNRGLLQTLWYTESLGDKCKSYDNFGFGFFFYTIKAILGWEAYELDEIFFFFF